MEMPLQLTEKTPTLRGIFFSSRRRHTRLQGDWSSDVCSSDLSWTVKNLLEFKNAQGVVVEGNTIENNWASGQQGYSILFTPRNQSGTAPLTVVRDIVVQ